MSGKQLQRTLRKSFTGWVPQFCCVFALNVKEEKEEQKQEPPMELKEFPDPYVDIFKEPVHLPPYRVINHSIELKPGSIPVSIRPIGTIISKRMR